MLLLKIVKMHLLTGMARLSMPINSIILQLIMHYYDILLLYFTIKILLQILGVRISKANSVFHSNHFANIIK